MILLTGATGLLGSRILFDLVSMGFMVRAMKRDTSRMQCVEHYFAAAPHLLKNIEWVNGDINDIYSLDSVMSGVNQVYHCAARVSFQPSDHDSMHHVNINGTANVVNVCLEKKVSKLCFVSSTAALGRTGEEPVVDESGSWKTSRLNSTYAISKYGAEREVWRGIAEGLNAVIVNPGVIIGPGNWKTDSSMLFRQVEAGLKFYTSGITGFVDVKDVSATMIKLMESAITSERFILVGENKPFRDVMDRIADKIGKSRPGVYAGPLLSGFAWRMEMMKSWLTGIKPVITRETARSANGKNFYSSEKIKSLLKIEFTPIMESIDNTAEIYLSYRKQLV
ncbi:MAG: NAD-dependent epimerase/dehydratase family protein [Bacteroidota bacterium]|nr:NAD-dependent epimerase/dehydratase family protein [Bacteroidota bacterium]